MPDFWHEQQNVGSTVGFDEVGCGPWAGPVMAGAVVLVPHRLPGSLVARIDDSKKLTPLRRTHVFEELQQLEGHACFSAIGTCSVEEVDALNVRQATLKAMERAATALRLPDAYPPITLGLVDGTLKLTLTYATQSLIKGDRCSLSIAAASILAKVIRDRYMKSLAEHHPEYGWQQNKGYGTAYHRAALWRFGPTCHHRQSFKPVKETLQHFSLC